jgi:site-specific DNA recombinase
MWSRPSGSSRMMAIVAFTLIRPGLEALRNLAAEGEIQTVPIYSPDRLSRKYAYQVLLSEELARCPVELIFLRAPCGATAQEQFGAVSRNDCGILTGTDCRALAPRQAAPRSAGLHQCYVGRSVYGYRYVKKSDTSAAYYTTKWWSARPR